MQKSGALNETILLLSIFVTSLQYSFFFFFFTQLQAQSQKKTE